MKKEKQIQSDKIIWSRIFNKSNAERWNQEKKITQNDLKNKGEKKTLIGG